MKISECNHPAVDRPSQTNWINLNMSQLEIIEMKVEFVLFDDHYQMIMSKLYRFLASRIVMVRFVLQPALSQLR